LAESFRLGFGSSEKLWLGDFGLRVEALAPLGDLEGLGDIWAGLGERLRFIFYDFITKILQNEVTLTKTRIFCLKFFSHLFFLLKSMMEQQQQRLSAPVAVFSRYRDPI
jgi:hypothetical protein